MPMPFTPSPNDGAIELLRSIFGKVIDGLVGGNPNQASSATANMLGEAFRFMNSGVLFFGTIILLWVTIFGITNTANDGEALGKKWSTFYTPLRTLVSAATLIPTASGYAGIQIILLLIVTYSIGFASNLWSSVVNYSVGQDVVEQAIKSVSDDPNFEALATDALRMQVCAAGVNKALAATIEGTPVKLVFQQVVSQPDNSLTYNPIGDKAFLSTTTSYRTRLMYKDPAWATSENICGQIALGSTFYPPATTSNSTADVTRSLQNAIGQIRHKMVVGLFSANSPISGIAANIVNASATNDGTIDTQQVSNTIAQVKRDMMNDIILEVSKQVKNENSDVAKKLSEKGWIYAGSLYMELGRMKDAIRNATSTSSNYVAGTNNFDNILTGDVARAANGILSNYTTVAAEVAKKTLAKQTAQATSAPKLPIIQTNFSASDFSDGGNGAKTMVTQWTNGLSTSLLNGTVHYLSAPNEDPVMRVKNVGDWLSTSAMTIMVTEAAMAASLDGLKDGAAAAANQPVAGAPFAVATGYISGVASLLGRIWGYLSTAISTLMYAGYYLGIWVPMIPFFVFGLGVVGWLVFIGEMLAAGVLWMAAHTTPARDDSFIGSQAQGYLLVMSGFFRPALMVLGLIFSIAILHPAVQYINEGFILTVRSNQADSVTGIFSLAGYSVAYCFLISSLFMMVFSLPQSFPDRILKWIGAGIGDMGEQNTMQRLESGASSQARTAAVGGAAMYAANAAEKAAEKEKKRNSGSDEAAQAMRDAPEGIASQSAAFDGQSAGSDRRSGGRGSAQGDAGTQNQGGGVDTRSGPEGIGSQRPTPPSIDDDLEG